MNEKLKKISEKFSSLDEGRKKFLIIICIVMLVLILITIITSIMLSQVVGSAGKVAGNLRNSGMAVKKGSKAYVSSTAINDENAGEKGLYEISKQNTSKLIDKNEYVRSINLYKGYLYYLAINRSENGNYVRQVVKIKPNGEKKQILVDDIETSTIGSDALNVSDGWVYFLNADKTLERVKTNGNKREPVSNEVMTYFQISGNRIYYTTNDDDFKKMKKDGTAIEKVGSGIELFQIVQNDAYYISRANGNLMALNLKENKEKTVIERKLKTFNIYGKTIYYAVNENEEQAIYKMKLSGKKNEKIVDLSSANVVICVVGDWIYYTDLIEDSPYYYAMYRIKTNGKDKQRINI